MTQNLFSLHRAGVVLALVILEAVLGVGPDASGQGVVLSQHPTRVSSASYERLFPSETPTPLAGHHGGRKCKAECHSAPFDGLFSQELEGTEAIWVVRAYYTDRRMVDDLAAWREPWEMHHDQGYLVLDVSPAEYRRLLEAGFRLEVDERLSARLNRPNQPLPGQTDGIPGFLCYRTVEETYATAQAIAAEHPNLATWIDVGDSWEKIDPGVEPGYDLRVLRLTNSALPGPKPKLFAMTAIHAREYATAELNTRFAEYLVDNYGLDPDVTWLLDYHEIHLLLVTNPDGRKWAEQGYYWRKNTDNDFCSGSDDRGVDLNRNFSFQWNCCGGSSGEECAETYHGPSAASEPETQVVQNYVRSQFPDQRGPGLGDPAPDDARGVFLDIHSYSRLVLWPWGFNADPAPNGTALQTLGRKMAYFNGYTPQQATSLYPVDGSTMDFAYGELGLAAYTFEIGTAFFQDCDTFEEEILPDNLPALLYAAKVSRAPYQTPAGPDAAEISATPLAVALGQPFTLTATIDDTRYHHQNGAEPAQPIVAAESYLDAPPWVTATTPISYPLAAVDGSFDETVETAAAVVDTSGLSLGRHTLFVRGRDADGNWGAVSALYVYVMDPVSAPLVEGYVRDGISDQPLAASVQAGVFQTETDPATGYYHMLVPSDTYDLSAVSAGYTMSTVTGIQASDYVSVHQDFYLYATCDVLTDEVESGNLGWDVEGSWAIVVDWAHSPTYAWTDSPDGSYENDSHYALTSPVFDLSDSEGFVLSFWHSYDLEAGYDYGYVEYSLDAGQSWTQAVTYTGRLNWNRAVVPLPELDGQPEARFRFLIDTDGWYRADGWYIDDVRLWGGGMICLDTFAPTVAFTSTSPGVVGERVGFGNLTTGTRPIQYRWDFGDGTGISTEIDPSHTYFATGTFSVSLQAASFRGRASHSAPVVVQPAETCQSLSSVTITGPTAGRPGVYTFAATYQPPTATLPISYAWDDGGTAATSLRELGVGVHTLTLTATNCLTASASDSHVVAIQPAPVCTDVAGVELTLLNTGSLYLGDVVVLSADVAPDDATKPYTYALSLNGGTLLWPQPSSDDPLILSHTLTAPGEHTVEVAVWNCAMTEPISDGLDVSVAVPGYRLYLPIVLR